MIQKKYTAIAAVILSVLVFYGCKERDISMENTAMTYKVHRAADTI